MGVGECAGEVVSQAQFTLAVSERELFESQMHLDNQDFKKAVQMAYDSMVHAAQGLIKTQNRDVSDGEDAILSEFRQRFYNTKLFHDKYAGSKFADFLFKAKDALKDNGEIGNDLALQQVQEAQLFIDAAHSCYNKLLSTGSVERTASDGAASPA
jgi:sulfite reductase (ferredoxin)